MILGIFIFYNGTSGLTLIVYRSEDLFCLEQGTLLSSVRFAFLLSVRKELSHSLFY